MAPTVHAVFENGVFRPTGPVALPESAEVAFEPRLVTPLAGAALPMSLSDPQLTLDEFREKLREMADMSTGQSLPTDWSRADLYDDHD